MSQTDAYCSSLFRSKQSVLHARESDLGQPHQMALCKVNHCIRIQSKTTGVVTTWLWHWWADEWAGSKRVLYVYGPSAPDLLMYPSLAGWRVHVHA